MSSNDKIKVIAIDDSVLIRKYVTQILSEIPNVEVIATAPNGKIGLQKLFLYKPDVVILDIEMQEMDGIEFLKYLKENVPEADRPFVIMFSSLVYEGSSATFEALAYGAADFIKKPEGQIQDNIDFLRKEFEIKINELYHTKEEKAAVPVESPIPAGTVLDMTGEPALTGIDNLEKIVLKKSVRPDLIAIGSSTGGPIALRKVFDKLGPVNVPLVIAQHMPAGFTYEFAKNLADIYKRKVLELKEGNELENGTVYVCPGGVHSRIVNMGGKFVYKSDSNNYEGFFFRPSVDIFFRSVLEASGKNTLAVILSGMGKDGSIESVRLRKSGAIVIAQDQASSVVWGMPGNSVKSGGVDIILDINDIGTAINRIISAA